MANSNANIRILMVDDLEPNHRLMSKYIEPFGYSIDHCYNGREGIARLQFQKYNICFTDVHMPDIDGIFMACYIRIEMNLTLPIILLAGTADMEEREIALGVGMDDYINKPLEVDKVNGILSRYIASNSVY